MPTTDTALASRARPEQTGLECRRRIPLTVTELRVALTVPDFDRALAFYRDGVGLPQIADWSSDHGKVVVLGAGRAALELLDQPQAELVDQIEAGGRVAGTVRLAFEVQDSDMVAQRLLADGAERVAAPVTTPWGDRNARIRTPDGMQLTLFATPSTAVPASLTALGPAREDRSMPDRTQRDDGWAWPDSLEGPVAAPGSHHALLETPAAARSRSSSIPAPASQNTPTGIPA